MDIKTQVLILKPNAEIPVVDLLISKTKAEVSTICKQEYNPSLDNVIADIIVWKLNTLNSEGLTGQSYNGISESYLDNYPVSIRKQLSALTQRVWFY